MTSVMYAWGLLVVIMLCVDFVIERSIGEFLMVYCASDRIKTNFFQTSEDGSRSNGLPLVM